MTRTRCETFLRTEPHNATVRCGTMRGAAVLPSTATGPRCTKGRPVRGSAGRLRRFLGPGHARSSALPRLRACARRSRTGARGHAIYPLGVTGVGLIGGGKMGSALLGGLLDAGWDADGLAVKLKDPAALIPAK